MIDEKKLIKKLNDRIDLFVKSQPEKRSCPEVEAIREFIQMLEMEAKYQREG